MAAPLPPGTDGSYTPAKESRRSGYGRGLFAEHFFNFADFALHFAACAFGRAFVFHARIAESAPRFFFDLAFDFARSSFRPIFAARFHHLYIARRCPGGFAVVAGKRSILSGLRLPHS